MQGKCACVFSLRTKVLNRYNADQHWQTDESCQIQWSNVGLLLSSCCSVLLLSRCTAPQVASFYQWVDLTVENLKMQKTTRASSPVSRAGRLLITQLLLLFYSHLMQYVNVVMYHLAHMIVGLACGKSSPFLSLPPGFCGADLLLHRSGLRPPVHLRHRPVRVQLGDERHLGVRHVGRVLVRDQQVRRILTRGFSGCSLLKWPLLDFTTMSSLSIRLIHI